MCRRWYTSYLHGVVTDNFVQQCYRGLVSWRKESVSSDCTQEVAACFTLVFAAHTLPARFLLVVQLYENRWVLCWDPREGASYPPSSSAVTNHKSCCSMRLSDFYVLGPLRRTEFADDLQQTSTWSKLSPPDSTSISSTPRQKRYRHGGKTLKCHHCLSGGLVCTICYLRCATSGPLGRCFISSQLQCCNQSQILLAAWDLVISISLDPLRCTQFADDLQQTST